MIATEPSSSSSAAPPPGRADFRLTRLPTTLLAYVFSCGSVRDYGALVATCVACGAVAKLGGVAASPRFVRCATAFHTQLGPPAGLLRLRPAAFATAGTWLAAHELQQLIDSGCLGRSLTALDVRLTTDWNDANGTRGCTTAIAQLDRLATCSPLLTHLVVRFSQYDAVFRRDGSGGDGGGAKSPFSRMTALRTLALSTFPLGDTLLLTWPPALRTLYIGGALETVDVVATKADALVDMLSSGLVTSVTGLGRGRDCDGSDVRDNGRGDGCDDGSGGGGDDRSPPLPSPATYLSARLAPPRSPLRELSLPVIRGAMWRLIASGLPQLTALESLRDIQTGDDDVLWPVAPAPHIATREVVAFEFPELQRFACSLVRLSSLQRLRMPALRTLKVIMMSQYNVARFRDDFRHCLACLYARARVCIYS